MRFDAIVVLGCRVGPGGRLQGAARRRVDRAAEAWRAETAPHVVLCGGRRWSGIAEAEAFARGLEERGVPSAAMTLECCSLSTAENARYCAAVFRARGFERAAVVTCDWHARRALRRFREVGIDATMLEAHSPREPPPRRVLRLARERMLEWVRVPLAPSWGNR